MSFMQNIIYLFVGGIFGVLVAALLTQKNHKKNKAYTRKIETNNSTLLEEKKELKDRVLRNEININNLTKIVEVQNEQIMMSLELISKLTYFRTHADVEQHIVASQRFRDYFDQLITTDVSDTYISD